MHASAFVTTHLAGRRDLPFRIATDERGILYCLGSGGLEIGQNKIFHLWLCKILHCQKFAYQSFSLILVFADSLQVLGYRFNILWLFYTFEAFRYLIWPLWPSCYTMKWPKMTFKESKRFQNCQVCLFRILSSLNVDYGKKCRSKIMRNILSFHFCEKPIILVFSSHLVHFWWKKSQI